MKKKSWPTWMLLLDDSLRGSRIHPRPSGTTVYLPRAWVRNMRLSGMPARVLVGGHIVN